MLWIGRPQSAGVGFVAGTALVLSAVAGVESPGARLVTGSRGPFRREMLCRSGAVTPDGRLVTVTAFARRRKQEREISDVFVRDMVSRNTRLVSVDSAGHRGNGNSDSGCISADGQAVVFGSVASNLVPDDLNGREDVFVRHLDSGETTRISVAADGTEANGGSSVWACSSISADGRYIVFSSDATNLVANPAVGIQAYLKDLQTGDVELISATAGGAGGNGESVYPSISGDGRLVAYQSTATDLVSGDTNGVGDIFVYDRVTTETRRVSVASDGTEADRGSYHPVVSDNGIVAFYSVAANLDYGDTNDLVDVFVHDVDDGATRRISVKAEGGQGNGGAAWPAISRDGETIVFTSAASDLIPEGTGPAVGVFAYSASTESLRLLSTDEEGVPGDRDSTTTPTSLSFDGTWCVFESEAINLNPRRRDGVAPDVFLVRVR